MATLTDGQLFLKARVGPVEIVTTNADAGGFLTTIYNGPLDGESWPWADESEARAGHGSAVQMIRAGGPAPVA